MARTSYEVDEVPLMVPINLDMLTFTKAKNRGRGKATEVCGILGA